MSLTTPAAILFDWDNTLVDTWPLIHRSLNVTLEAMGHKAWSMDEVRASVKHSMRDAFPELFGDRWKEAAELYQTTYRSMHLEALTPLSGALEVLDIIKARGIYCAVVSNKRGPSLRAEAEHLAWAHYFAKTIGADDAARDKPHADPAIMALDGSDITPGKHVWFIGDTGADLGCAENLGATAILYGAYATQNNTHDGHGFDVHVTNHEELAALIVANTLSDAG